MVHMVYIQCGYIYHDVDSEVHPLVWGTTLSTYTLQKRKKVSNKKWYVDIPIQHGNSKSSHQAPLTLTCFGFIVWAEVQCIVKLDDCLFCFEISQN